MSGKAVSRFDNISTDDMIAREVQERADLKELQGAIRARMISESGIVVGKVYRVTDDGHSLEGRLLLVGGVNAGIGWLGVGVPGAYIDGQGFRCFAWGRLNGKSAARDGWTIKRQNVGVKRLTLATADADPTPAPSDSLHTGEEG